MQHLSLQTALGVLKIVEQFTQADVAAQGISDDDFELVTSSNPWRRDVLGRVMRTLNTIMFGALEAQAIPKIQVPAEFVAPIIVAVVHPTNIMVACVWLAQERQTGVGALDRAARQEQAASLDPVSADQLFALVCMLADRDETNAARQRYRERMGKRIAQATKGNQK